MLILLWLEYYYIFLRFFDLPLALRDRGLVNVVQYWCGPVAVDLRMVRDIHWLNVSTSPSPSNDGECPQTSLSAPVPPLDLRFPGLDDWRCVIVRLWDDGYRRPDWRPERMAGDQCVHPGVVLGAAAFMF